ncbi:MAG: Tim44/TimA family putative adaptor protein [Hyphomicrobiales bacterium]|jgi:predicted lipid-binding transport protein (Tim44 family)|nr:Tim44/TimA family putative adaptor protein [Hyphomicrobiales bacterium]
MQGSFDIFTLVFLALAVFVAWKLRSVLGQKTGHEQPPGDVFGRKPPPQAPAPDSNVIRLPGVAANDAAPEQPFRWTGLALPGTPVANGLDAIEREERGFDGRGFLDGSKAAYEMIVMSFANGDRKTLKGLLSKEVYDDFDQAISEREKRGDVVETTFVSMDGAEIVAAEVRGKTGMITVQFSPKLIKALKNKAGATIDGSPDSVVDVTETWTFSRQLGSRDPNWLLVATGSDD